MFIGEHSLILRLDSGHTFNCVLDTEKDNKPEDITVFGVKPLNILQYTLCKDCLLRDRKEGTYVGSYCYMVVECGLCSWDNYVYADNGQPIEFNKANINTLPFSVIEELSKNILSLSELDVETEGQIRLATQWSEYLSKHKRPEDWTCTNCIKAKRMGQRNCDGTLKNYCIKCGNKTEEDICEKCGGKTRPEFFLRISNKPIKEQVLNIDYVTQCPQAIIRSSVISLINTVNFIEDSKSLPVSGAALEQSNYYYQVRQIILSQRNAALKEDYKPDAPSSTGVSHLKQSFSNRRK